MSSNLFVWLRAPLLAGAALLLANTASAQQCMSNDDCGEGYACELAAKPCAAIDIACAPDDAECAKRAADPCAQDQDYKECRPAACETDADCGASMACHAFEQTTCPTAAAGGSAGSSGSGNSAAPAFAPCVDTGDGGVCGGGTAGSGAAGAPSTPPPTCTTMTMRECTPRYALPCEHDADCGATGFKCVEQVQASCPGTGAGGAAATPPPAQPQPEATDAGQPMALVAPGCTTMPTGTFVCELQVIPCADDSACPATFECVSNPNRVACGSGTAMTGTAGGGSATPTPAQDAGSAIPADGQGAGGGDDPCAGLNDGLPEKVCQPPNYYGYGYGGSREDAAEAPKGGTATGAPLPSTADAGVAQGPGTAPPTTPGNDTTNTGSHTDGDMQTPAADNGCAVSAPGASDSTQVFATLSVFGVIAFLLRRRARIS